MAFSFSCRTRSRVKPNRSPISSSVAIESEVQRQYVGLPPSQRRECPLHLPAQGLVQLSLVPCPSPLIRSPLPPGAQKPRRYLGGAFFIVFVFLDISSFLWVFFVLFCFSFVSSSLFEYFYIL